MKEQRKLRIVVDERERASGVPEILRSKGVRVDFSQLLVGDYILTPDSGVERKTVQDLVSSIFDGRLFKQSSVLSSAYEKPFLIVEGDLLETREALQNPRVVYGALASIILNYNIRILYTPSPEDTATALVVLLDHLTKERRAGPLLQKPRKSTDPYLQQVYMVSSLPGVGEKLAARLLESFKTPRRVFSASASDLTRVQGVGHARAVKIEKALDTHMEPREVVEKQTRLPED